MSIHFCHSFSHCNMYSYGRGLCISGRIYDQLQCMIILLSVSVLGFHNNGSSNTQGVTELDLDVALVIYICQGFFSAGKYWIILSVHSTYGLKLLFIRVNQHSVLKATLCFSEAHCAYWFSDTELHLLSLLPILCLQMLV